VILIPLIVVPCSIIGFGAVFFLDWAGLLPQADGGGTAAARPRNVPLRNRRLGLAAIVIMGAWVLAWIVLLLVGLSVVWV
jgi:hypothetical protein